MTSKETNSKKFHRDLVRLDKKSFSAPKPPKPSKPSKSQSEIKNNK